MAKELRITFKESESYLYEYIKEKSSPSAFLKDLAAIEKKKEEIYLNTNCDNTKDTTNAIHQNDTQLIHIEELDISDLDF